MASTDFPLAFSDEFDDEGADLFAQVDAAGLEGIVSKCKGSRYVSGDTALWLKTKTFQVGEFVVIGVTKTPTGAPSALLAQQGDDGLEYVGNAFVTYQQNCVRRSGFMLSAGRCRSHLFMAAGCAA